MKRKKTTCKETWIKNTPTHTIHSRYKADLEHQKIKFRKTNIIKKVEQILEI